MYSLNLVIADTFVILVHLKHHNIIRFYRCCPKTVLFIICCKLNTNSCIIHFNYTIKSNINVYL